MLLLEAAVVLTMVGTWAHQRLPATELTVGDTTLVIKAEVPVAAPGRRPASAYTFPVEGFTTDAVISVFGDARGGRRSHQGIDIKAPRGTPVVAVTDGFVERLKEGGSGGRQLYLRDGTGRLFDYAHLDDWSVEEFDAVRAGEPLGTVGDTGNARGTTPHLHFEVLLGKDREAVDPIRFWSHP